MMVLFTTRLLTTLIVTSSSVGKSNSRYKTGGKMNHSRKINQSTGPKIKLKNNGEIWVAKLLKSL